MVKRRKKRNDIVEGMTPAMGLGMGSIGAGLLATPLESKLSSGLTPLSTTATVTSSFVGPVAVIGASGVVLKQLNKTQKKMKRRKK